MTKYVCVCLEYQKILVPTHTGGIHTSSSMILQKETPWVTHTLFFTVAQ